MNSNRWVRIRATAFTAATMSLAVYALLAGYHSPN
jgi:hypothetical protein